MKIDSLIFAGNFAYFSDCFKVRSGGIAATGTGSEAEFLLRTSGTARVLARRAALILTMEISSNQKSGGNVQVMQTLFFAVTLFFLIFFVTLRANWVISHTYPATTDGFFYLQEIRHWIEHGSGYYVSFSVFFRLIALVAGTFSIGSELLIYKVLVLFSTTALSLALALPVLRRGSLWLLPSMMVLPWISDVVFFRQYAFIKQSFSFSLFLLGCSIYFYQRDHSLKTHISYPKLTAFVLIAIGISTHLFTAAIFACLLFWESLIGGKSRHPAKILAALTALALIALSALYREKDILKLYPLEYWSTWKYFCDHTPCFQYDYFEYIFCSGIFLYITGRIWAKRPVLCESVFFLGIYVLFNLPLWDIQGQFVYRAGLATLWMLFYAYSLAAGRNSLLPGAVHPVILLSYILAYFTLTHLRPREIMMPATKLIEYGDILRSWLPPDAEVRAPHTMQFKITYFLDRRSVKHSSDVRNAGKAYIYESGDRCRRRDCWNVTPQTEKEGLTRAGCIIIESQWCFARTKPRP